MPTIRGACRCGAIRYEIASEPTFGVQCQCLDCQHQSGGGHASFVGFPADALRLTGTLRFYESKADSGNTVRRGFCPTCGSPLVALSSGMPDMTAVMAGSLDEPSLFKPQLVVYTSRGHAWDRIDPALPSYPVMPPRPGAEQAAR
jgi:hypothetical protein